MESLGVRQKNMILTNNRKYIPMYNLNKAMEQQKVLEIVKNLPKLKYKPVPTRENEIRTVCPFCEAKGHTPDREIKLYINISPNRILYHCYRCGTSGSIQISNTQETQTLKQISTLLSSTPPTPKINKLSKEIGKQLTKQAIQYLQTRRVPARIWDKQHWLEGNTQYKGHIIIPIYEYGREVAFVTRDYTGKAKIKSLFPFPNKASLLYNFDYAKDFTEIILVEGVFDSVRYENSMALFGKVLYPMQAYKLSKYIKATDIVICLDSPMKDTNITPFVNNIAKILKEYTDKTIWICTLPYGDPADYDTNSFYEILSKNSKKVY